MSWVAIGVAVVGAVASHESGRQATRAQEQSQKEALAASKATQETAQERLDEFAAQGAPARQAQAALVGLGGQEAQQQAISAIEASPGQQFLRDQQERALVRNAAAIGGLGGGNVRSALQAQAFQRAQTDIANQFNRLGAIGGAGQQAALSQAQLGQLGGAQQAELLQQQGAIRASGILSQNQALQQALGTGVGIFAQQGGFNQQPAQTTTQAPVQTTQPSSGLSISGGAGLRPIGQ